MIEIKHQSDLNSPEKKQRTVASTQIGHLCNTWKHISVTALDNQVNLKPLMEVY